MLVLVGGIERRGCVCEVMMGLEANPFNDCESWDGP